MRKVFVLVFLALMSCKGEEKEQEIQNTLTVFDLDDLRPTVDKLKLSDIAENIEYIPLETRDDCLIGNINDIQFIDEFIFVYGVGDIFQFDHQGSFIRKLFRIGKGPGECYARDFAIDTDNSLVYIFDNYKYKYNIYSFDGDFISSFDDPNPNNNTGRHFMIHNNQLVFEVADYYIPQSFIMSYDIGKREIVYKYKNNYKEIDDSDVQKKKGYMWNSGLLRSFEDRILFKEKFCDTIFQTTDFIDVTPRYVFKIGNNALSYKDFHTIFLRDIIDKKFIVSYFETSRYVFVQISAFKPLSYIWVFDKASNIITVKKASTPEDWNLENDFDTGPGISMAHIFGLGLHSGDYIYSYIEPFKLIEALNSEDSPIEKDSRMYELAHQVNENDNPILVKIKLKSTNN